jgi:hypothetical protein
VQYRDFVLPRRSQDGVDSVLRIGIGKPQRNLGTLAFTGRLSEEKLSRAARTVDIDCRSGNSFRITKQEARETETAAARTAGKSFIKIKFPYRIRRLKEVRPNPSNVRSCLEGVLAVD